MPKWQRKQRSEKVIKKTIIKDWCQSPCSKLVSTAKNNCEGKGFRKSDQEDDHQRLWPIIMLETREQC